MATSLELWAQVKELVAALEKDVTKNGERSNCSAGVRVRHGSRELAKLCRALSKATLEQDKATKATRAATPEAVARKAKKATA